MDDKQLRHAQLIVSRAKIQMLESHPFYAHILTHLAFRLDEAINETNVTITNGCEIGINPTGYVKLTKGVQVTVLGHELLHCLDGHLWRRGSRDAYWANIAQDIYICHVLNMERFEKDAELEASLTNALHKRAKRKPSGFAYDLNDFTGQFWEQIYEAILPAASASPKPQSGQGDGEGDGNGPEQAGCGCYKPATGPDASAAREQWKQWIREAGMYAKMAGAQPGRWQELVEAATPQVPFETRFYDFLKRGLGGDQTFDSFARRHISRGLYLPSEVIEQMGETVLVNDTSGSRSHDDLAYAYGVFRSWRALHPCRVHVVDCDTECHWRTFEEFEELPAKWEAKGRGGTHFTPPFVEVAKRQLDISLLVFFTDGYLFDHEELAKVKPTYEVMWTLTGEYDRQWTAPFGEMVRVTRPE